MKKKLLFILPFIFAGCHEPGDQLVKKRIGDEIIESKFINDTTYQGPTKYYTLSNVLKGEIVFRNGIKNGYSKNYYPNGVVNDSLTFANGIPNGYHFVYDSTGVLEYKDFFYQGRRMGDMLFYDKGKLSEYDFISFDGELLYKAKYDENGSVKEFGGQIINQHISTSIINSQWQNVLFLYTIKPPSVSIRYSICLFDSVSHERKSLRNIGLDQGMFYEFSLPEIHEKASFFIQANYDDTLNKFHKVHIRPLQLDDNVAD